MNLSIFKILKKVNSLSIFIFFIFSRVIFKFALTFDPLQDGFRLENKNKIYLM